MAMRRNNNQDWAEQVPQRRHRSEYDDYGWERGESVLPEFRDPSVRETPWEEARFRGHQGQRQGQNRGGRFERDYDYEHRDLYPGHGYASEQQGPAQRGSESGYALEQGQQGGQEYRSSDWWRPGPYTGRGPKGYQRSDQRIQEDVNDRLAEHGQLDASDVTVQVQNSEVTLTGTVDSRQAKRMAEDVADSVRGVTDVHNQLTIQRQQQS